MKPYPVRPVWRPAWLAVFVASYVTGAMTAPAAAQARGMRILLTNDDGYAAAGLVALREALVGAGHSVTVVAPLDDRSWSGASITPAGLVDYYQQSPDVWAVDGTPADAVSLALVHVMREAPPELVLVGIDHGDNVGTSILSSGVVGAALTASRVGVPAIVASLDRSPDEESPGASDPSLGRAVGFVVDLVRRLRETDAQGLLAPRAVLNVNYPADGPDGPAGVRFAPVARVRSLRQVYAVAGDTGPADVRTVRADVDRAEADSDLALLRAGYVTLSVFDGNLDAGAASWETLRARLAIER